MTRPLPSPVAVTGAGGFVGSHVCRTLIERGVDVRGLVRRVGAAVPRGVAAVMAPLDKPAALGAALDGAQGVIHLAAHVHQGSASDGTDAAAAFQRVNVDGTRNLLDAAVAAGVRDLLFVSSVKAVGDGGIGESRWTESTIPHPVDAYGATKLDAERLVRDYARRHGFHAPILRLPLVYGPGMKANALRLFDAVAKGIPLPFGGIRNCRSLLYSGNLAAAVVAVLEHEEGNDTFFVSDGHDLSTPELVREIAQAMGRPARLLPLPLGVLQPAARAGDLLARVLPFPLTTSALDRLAGSLTVDSSRLTRQTGFRPPFTVRDALAATVAWYRARPAAG